LIRERERGCQKAIDYRERGTLLTIVEIGARGQPEIGEGIGEERSERERERQREERGFGVL
jgi:hypothetical protein